MSPILIGFWIRLNCLDVYIITRFKIFVKDRKCPFCYFLALKPIVGLSSLLSSGFGRGRGIPPPNAPSNCIGFMGIPVGVVDSDSIFTICTIALSDNFIVMLLLMVTSVCLNVYIL